MFALRRFAGPWIVIALCLCPAAARAQTLVDLRVSGPATILEGNSAAYEATAVFDDGGEFEVTLSAVWSVEPGTYASIDAFGRLATLEVPEDQDVTVRASFTWGAVTLEDALAVTIQNEADEPGGDPWPFWGRTASRLGRTTTVGPQTPTIAWSVLISTHPNSSNLEASPVLDEAGRIFVGTISGVSAVDSVAREVLWEVDTLDGPRGVATRDGSVVWGTPAPSSTIHCYDAASGEEVWHVETGGALRAAPVIDPNGVVYISDSGGHVIHARRIEDGAEVWTAPVADFTDDSPSLDYPDLLLSSGVPFARSLTALDPQTGELLWDFATERELYGMAPVGEGRVYIGGNDYWLYCVDSTTGEEMWRFYAEKSIRGAVAVGHDGTVYAATTGGGAVAKVVAVSPEGEELWQYMPGGNVLNAPIVDGLGTLYVCSGNWTGSFYEGRVHAIRPDGTLLWEKLMPDNVSASPMLAPDGTLYVVCRDKHLYAFKDPPGVIEPAGKHTPREPIERP